MAGYGGKTQPKAPVRDKPVGGSSISGSRKGGGGVISRLSNAKGAAPLAAKPAGVAATPAVPKTKLRKKRKPAVSGGPAPAGGKGPKYGGAKARNATLRAGGTDPKTGMNLAETKAKRQAGKFKKIRPRDIGNKLPEFQTQEARSPKGRSPFKNIGTKMGKIKKLRLRQ